MRAWLERLLDPSVAIAQKLQGKVVEPATRLIAAIE